MSVFDFALTQALKGYPEKKAAEGRATSSGICSLGLGTGKPRGMQFSGA